MRVKAASEVFCTFGAVFYVIKCENLVKCIANFISYAIINILSIVSTYYFSDKEDFMANYKGRIVEIEKYQNRGEYLKQGVKKQDQYKYDNFPGGNGTYVIGGEYYGTSLDVKIVVYNINKPIVFDVYDDILAATGKKKISAKLLSKIESHEGDKIDVYSDDGHSFYFDINVLIK